LTVIPPPTINRQPSNQTADIAQPATFSLQASGPRLSYQWQKKAPGDSSFNAISDETGSSYSTPPLTLGDSQTQYQCSVTNQGGTVTSNSALLVVKLPDDLSSVLVYPNPWDARKYTGAPMRFTSLPNGSTVKLFTIAAHYVRTLQVSSAGIASWDMTNDSGQPVASGYYLYIITDNQGRKTTGKIAVVR
jgi:hypothetical protein